VILSSFSCDHCGYSNNDVTFGGAIADKGVKIDVNVYSKDCLNRFVVKSEFGTITIPEIELEIPRDTQKATIKTIEGYLRATADGLKLNQEERRLQDPDTAMKIDEFIEKLERMCDGKDMPYHFLIDDPSGNSYVQNPHAPAKDVYVSGTMFLTICRSPQSITNAPSKS
jgi:zinc finger protein